MFNGDPQVAESEKADIQVDQAQDAPVSDLEAVTAERDLYLDQLQRSMAEFANYRRRVDQERSQARKLATRDLLLDVVRIADDFKRALAAVPEEDAEAPWLKGISLIERNLTTLLEREGVTPVNAMGQRFDPSMHEAVAVDPGSSATIVTEVFQNGYWHGDQLLRPAIVKVGDAGPEDQPDAEDTRQT
jgi:molecular chaperone GrpE